MEAKAQAEQQSALLSKALEELKNLRASEFFEIEKQKRRLYGRKSEKSSSLFKDINKDLKDEKDDFDGNNPGGGTCGEFATPAASEMNGAAPSSSRLSCRFGYDCSDFG